MIMFGKVELLRITLGVVVLFIKFTAHRREVMNDKCEDSVKDGEQEKAMKSELCITWRVDICGG